MPEHSGAPTGTLLAFDFGIKRIGVALGESLIGQARALTTLRDEANTPRFAAIEKLIREWQPALLVVGLPLDAEGRAHDMTARAQRFANQLKGRFGLPVALVDERFTSVEAESQLKQRGGHWTDTKEAVDATAAQIILQSYFDDPARR